MALQLSSQVQKDHVVIQVGGEIDVATAPELGDFLRIVTTQDHPHLVLDFTEVTLLCAAGLTALLIAQREARRLEGSLLVVAAHGIVAKVFRVTGLEDCFTLCPAVTEALTLPLPAPAVEP
ncbi:STAS domain-containing protein [Actinomadura scrupuli]|uniref:STAS domain-containing protein n=1 Tax=Actinomadura scrupuli TaxID=559629 RepID=UPI003D96FB4C